MLVMLNCAPRLITTKHLPIFSGPPPQLCAPTTFSSIRPRNKLGKEETGEEGKRVRGKRVKRVKVKTPRFNPFQLPPFPLIRSAPLPLTLYPFPSSPFPP